MKQEILRQREMFGDTDGGNDLIKLIIDNLL